MISLCATIKKPALTVMFLLLAMTIATTAFSASYYLRFELGKGAAYGGSPAGGETFLYDYQPAPIHATDSGGGGNCGGEVEKWYGTGSGVATGGQCAFSIMATRRCFSDPNGYAQSYCVAEMTITDVFFVSAGSGLVPVSLNLQILNDYVSDKTASPLQALVKIGSSTVYNSAPPATGLVTTSTTNVPVNQPVSVFFQLRGPVNAISTGTLDAALSFVSGSTAASAGVLAAASSMPVFNVPAGVTVNSTEGNIINNYWIGDSTVATEHTTWGKVKALYQ